MFTLALLVRRVPPIASWWLCHRRGARRCNRRGSGAASASARRGSATHDPRRQLLLPADPVCQRGAETRGHLWWVLWLSSASLVGARECEAGTACAAWCFLALALALAAIPASGRSCMVAGATTLAGVGAARTRCVCSAVRSRYNAHLAARCVDIMYHPLLETFLVVELCCL